MANKRSRNDSRILRQTRNRKHISGTTERPRLSLFISNCQVYTQIIDDTKGMTLAAASTAQADLRETVKGKSKTEQCREVGRKIAEKAKEAGVSKVVFDKSGYKYGKRLSALADAAREGGLDF